METDTFGMTQRGTSSNMSPIPDTLLGGLHIHPIPKHLDMFIMLKRCLTLGARLRGTTHASKKGSEKVLGRVLGRVLRRVLGSEKGSPKGFLEGRFQNTPSESKTSSACALLPGGMEVSLCQSQPPEYPRRMKTILTELGIPSSASFSIAVWTLTKTQASKLDFREVSSLPWKLLESRMKGWPYLFSLSL